MDFEGFTYDLPIPASEINAEKLIHRSFVQVAPDGSHLVPGQMQLDFKPEIGEWLELGRIYRNLPKRYFVQYLDQNTLVPGSVIQANRFPPGKWKEIKRLPFPEFHRILAGEVAIYDDHVNPWTFLHAEGFLNYQVMPVLDAIQPGKYAMYKTPLSMQMFYFQGTFAELDNDASKLEVFSEPDSYFTYNDSSAGGESSFLTMKNDFTGFEFITARPTAPDGYFTFVLKIPASADNPVYYVVFENFFHRYHYNLS
jgi:hypothetical protein